MKWILSSVLINQDSWCFHILHFFAILLISYFLSACNLSLIVIIQYIVECCHLENELPTNVITQLIIQLITFNFIAPSEEAGHPQFHFCIYANELCAEIQKHRDEIVRSSSEVCWNHEHIRKVQYILNLYWSYTLNQCWVKNNHFWKPSAG